MTAWKIDRRNLSSDQQLGQSEFLSAVDFERSEKVILLALELRRPLHSQGQEWPNTNRSLGSRRSTETDGQEM
jgi:hypothetical protein